jgi:hypothetical protein
MHSKLTGQYLREKFQAFFDDRFVPYFLIVFTFWIVCLVEWTQALTGERSDPRFWLLLSLLVTVYGGLQTFRLYPQLRRHRRGGRGQATVAEVLDRMQPKGFAAFNDLSENDFDVDHIVVGPSGIYVMETKTRAVFGSGTIDYRNENELILGGRITDNHPLKQTRAAAEVVRNRLQEHFHQQYPVKPVVVFMGDWHVNRQANDVDVAVITASQLEAYFDRQQPELTSAEIAQVCAHLQRSV